METKLKSYPKLIPNGCEHCKGHANWMLDDPLDTREARDLVIKAIDNYLPHENIGEQNVVLPKRIPTSKGKEK